MQTQGTQDVVVLGGGARENAFAWKFAQSPHVGTVYVFPGNAATAEEPKVCNVPYGGIGPLADFVAANDKIAFTIVGPEAPLDAGVVDEFLKRELPIFGPTQAATRIESSKAFAKGFMYRHHIRTAPWSAFFTPAQAHAYVDACAVPMVVKADWLALGKGVVVAKTLEAAHAAVDKFFADETMPQDKRQVIIEDCIVGWEMSYIVMVGVKRDGKQKILPLASSQDYKPRDENNQGPNTGGVGAESPAPGMTPEMEARIMRDVIEPAVRGLADEGTPFTGFLYAGLMIDADGNIWVLEFNARSGDPENPVIMMRLQGDLFEIIKHALAGTLDQAEAKWDPRTALAIVLADEGYPDNPQKGAVIDVLPPAETLDCKVFGAGVVLKDGKVVVSGGRVYCVTALGNGVAGAQARAYPVAQGIMFDRKYMRMDIGGSYK